MQLDLDNLPSDTVLLHQLVRDMASVVEQRADEIERLQLIIKQLQRTQFGRRSERLDADQLALGLEDVETDQVCAEATQEPVAKPKDSKPRRKPLPDHLPREEVRIDVGAATCACCGGALHPIGESVSEMLDWVPAQLRVVRIRRPKYGCRTCGTVRQAPAPERPIAGGLATPALLAQVLVSKYCDHTPLYRQSQIFARHGVELDRSTLAGWVGGACWWLDALHERLCADGFGCTRATKGRGADQRRRQPSSCSRLIARASGRRRIWNTSPGFSTSMATPASSGCRHAAMSSWPPVGRIRVATSTNSSRQVARLSRLRRCGGSANSMRSKSASAASRRRFAWPSGGRSPSRLSKS